MFAEITSTLGIKFEFENMGKYLSLKYSYAAASHNLQIPIEFFKSCYCQFVSYGQASSCSLREIVNDLKTGHRKNVKMEVNQKSSTKDKTIINLVIFPEENSNDGGAYEIHKISLIDFMSVKFSLNL